MADYCNHLKDLFDAEKPFLDNEIKIHKWCLCEKIGNIGDDEAQIDYVKSHLKAWGTGFASVYCTMACEGEGCNAYQAKQKSFNENIKDLKTILEDKENRKFSIEEVEKIYVFKLGPSYWKGCVDALMYLKSKKI
jgi:uncharacterized protein YukE